MFRIMPVAVVVKACERMKVSIDDISKAGFAGF